MTLLAKASTAVRMSVARSMRPVLAVRNFSSEVQAALRHEFDASQKDNQAYMQLDAYFQQVKKSGADAQAAKPALELPVRHFGSSGVYADSLWLEASRGGEAQLKAVEKDFQSLMQEYNTVSNDGTSRFLDMQAYEALINSKPNKSDKTLMENPPYVAFYEMLAQIKAGKKLTGANAMPADYRPFQSFCEDGLMSSDKQAQIVERVFQGQLQPLTFNLLKTMAVDGRLKNFSQVASNFLETMSAFRNEVVGTVITAEPLDKKFEPRFKKVISEQLASNESLIFDTAVDERIVGGFKIILNRRGDLRMLDMTVADKVQEHKARLLN